MEPILSPARPPSASPSRAALNRLRPGAPPGPAPLGKLRKEVEAKAREAAGLGVESARAARFRRQDAARELVPELKSLGHCCRSVVSGVGAVALTRGQGGGGFRGVQRCGSPWACPVCAPRIAGKRAEEAAEGLRCWEAKGGVVLLLTLTHRHERGEALAALIGTHNRALKRMRQSWMWRRLKAEGMAGTISGAEATHGEAAGWHWHTHLLLLVTADQARDLAGLRDKLSAEWRAALAAEGRDATDAAGCDLADGRRAHRYVAAGEWGAAWEAVGGAGKRGRDGNRSAPELLADATEGDLRAAGLFREWALATKGKRAVVWSHGLRARLGLGQEASDEELAAAEEEEAETVALLPLPSWRVICRRRMRGALLDAVAAEGWCGAAGVCARLGLPPPLEPLRRPAADG